MPTTATSGSGGARRACSSTSSPATPARTTTRTTRWPTTGRPPEPEPESAGAVTDRSGARRGGWPTVIRQAASEPGRPAPRPDPGGVVDESTVSVEPSSFVPDVLSGRVALVTGGATGIGKEICRVLGAHGAAVVMASRKQDVLEAAVAELSGEGLDVSFGVCDVRDAEAVRAVVDGVVAERGRLDIVVNNAAGNFPAPMSTISPNGFKAVVDIDLLGTYNVTRA